MATLRRRLENSETLARLIGGGIAGYVRLCRRSIRWTRSGFEEIADALAEGPVILVMWHSRILMAPADLEAFGTFTTLRAPSPAARVSGAMQARFGMAPIPMWNKTTNQAASREVLRRLKEGQSVGLTGDGPLGPARQMKDPPFDWARVSGAPIFLYAFSCTRQRRLGSWDRMLVPRLFGRGHAAVARWPVEIPRRPGPSERQALIADLGAALDAHQREVDAVLGLPPGP